MNSTRHLHQERSRAAQQTAWDALWSILLAPPDTTQNEDDIPKPDLTSLGRDVAEIARMRAQ